MIDYKQKEDYTYVFKRNVIVDSSDHSSICLMDISELLKSLVKSDVFADNIQGVAATINVLSIFTSDDPFDIVYDSITE